MALPISKVTPIKKNVSAFKRPRGFIRAQDLSVSTLRHRSDRGRVAVSASRAEKRKAGYTGAKTSVSRLRGNRKATSSISRAMEKKTDQKRSVMDSIYHPDADVKRYDYARRRLAERVAEEKKQGKQFFDQLVRETTDQSVEDAKLTYKDRIRMKVKIDRASKRGRISAEDAKLYKTRIDTMN